MRHSVTRLGFVLTPFKKIDVMIKDSHSNTFKVKGFTMKKAILAVFTLSLLSANAVSQTDSYRHCASTERTYSSQDQSIFESVENSPFTNDLDSNAPVEIYYKSEYCAKSPVVPLDGGLPNTSGLAQEGDTRTITQTRGNVRTVYSQVFENGNWMTKSVKTDWIDLPTDPV